MITRDITAHTNALAAYMPNGALFEAKALADSNFRQLLRGFAGEIFSAQGHITLLGVEYLPDETTLFLSEWERALSIPDDCFSGTGTNDERRRDILVKLVGLGLQTAPDFEFLADLFGEAVTVLPGSEYTGYPFAVADDQKRYYIIIEFTPTGGGFPYTFPFVFGSETIRILECLFDRLKPSNCRVLFRRIAPVVGGYAVVLESGTFTVPAGVTSIDVLVVAGGGGGGSRQGGGGGGGGVLVVPNRAVTPGEGLPVVIGVGGAGGTSGGLGTSGADSSFDSNVAVGGGGGGGRTSDPNGAPGGSGGGGTANASNTVPGDGGTGSNEQGYDGGAGNTGPVQASGGGGGGGGAVGQTAPGGGVSGGGGGGVTLSTLGFPEVPSGAPSAVAGGGGGGSFDGVDLGTPGTGGVGGGGDGGNFPGTLPLAGAVNTGGGGGGSGDSATAGASGGSGIVIITWPGGVLRPSVNSPRAITVTL